METSTLTVQERFEAAISEATENGLQFIENHEGNYQCQCCTDVSDEIDDVDAPYAFNLVWDTGFEWGYAGQADLFQLELVNEPVYVGTDEDGEDEYEDDEIIETIRLGWTKDVSFSHDNGGGALLASALRNHGFEVDWNGNEFTKVIVTLK